MLKALWKELLVELTEGSAASDARRQESLINFVRTPLYLERTVAFGTLVCLGAFLDILTILPLRFCLSIASSIKSWSSSVPIDRRKYQDDIFRGLIVVLTLVGLMQLNTSRVYHGIRGQAGVTLFVMFSIFEVTDQFFHAVGQDILENLLPSTTTTRSIVFLLIGLVYVAAHSFVLLWQLVTLNVAVNSYSNALLSLMLTSQFGEIKSAVVKKFDTDTLFEITCTDIIQRFQLVLMLFSIVMRNLLEPNPRSTLGPATLVTVSIVAVDWLKHSYIVIFNELRPEPVYTRFLNTLISDFRLQRQRGTHYMLMKRLGLPVLPLAVVCVRYFSKCTTNIWIISLLWLILLISKLCIGILLSYWTTVGVPSKLMSTEKGKPELENKYKREITDVSHSNSSKLI